MIKNNYWAHVAPDGTEPWSFLIDEGYNYYFAGENLAKDYTNAPSTIKAWMNSPEHKKNILDGNYTEQGITVRRATLQGATGLLVVHFFGSPAVAMPETPSRSGRIIDYHEWCTNTEIKIYEYELITKESSDGNIYTMTQGDWDCYENYLNK